MGNVFSIVAEDAHLYYRGEEITMMVDGSRSKVEVVGVRDKLVVFKVIKGDRDVVESILRHMDKSLI